MNHLKQITNLSATWITYQILELDAHWQNLGLVLITFKLK